VTWELMEAVGGEITACQEALSVLHHVTVAYLFNVWRDTLPVTLDLMEAVGVETTACQKALTVFHHVTPHFLLNVWREK